MCKQSAVGQRLQHLCSYSTYKHALDDEKGANREPGPEKSAQKPMKDFFTAYFQRAGQICISEGFINMLKPWSQPAAKTLTTPAPDRASRRCRGFADIVQHSRKDAHSLLLESWISFPNKCFFQCAPKKRRRKMQLFPATAKLCGRQSKSQRRKRSRASFHMSGMNSDASSNIRSNCERSTPRVSG